MIRGILYKCRRIASALAIVLLITGTIQPVAFIFASESTAGIYREIREIRSAEDLMLLSQKSRNESYTKDVCYVLKNDIDLTGTDFKGISVFSGCFDGASHIIKGMHLTERQYKTGFIRTVTGSGRVKDLKLSGIIEPEGEMSSVGGIAGENYGTLENCSFEGYILTFEIAGGITGHNRETGIIRNCLNTASVNAMRRTGGIAGFNEGLIEDCENRGNVNFSRRTAHEVMDEEKDGGEEENTLDKLIPDSIDLKDEDLFRKFDNGLKINYTGGIAGVCSGIIRTSKNSGTVGYPHLGYKTGGITGYDRGILSWCANNGQIFGRKDVGGIAGQFEPYAVNAYSEDSLSRTGDALTELSERTEELNREFGVQDDTTKDHIDKIRNTSDVLREVIKNYKEYYRCKDDSVEKEIRNKTDNIRNILDSIELKRYDRDTRDAIEELKNTSDDIHKLLDAAAEAAGAGIRPEMSGYLGKISGMVKGNNAAIDTIIDKTVRANKDGKELKEDLEDLRSAGGDLDDYLRGCIDDYKKDLRITSDDIKGYVDTLSNETDILFDALKISDREIRKDVDSLIASLNTFNDSVSESYREIQEELQKIYDTDGKEDVFTDLSDNDEDSEKKGILRECINSGNVEADINGGGIAGTITDEPDTQSDFEVVSQGQISLNYDRFEKATVLKCRNDGDITVRNSYAGGIVGRADLGAVISSDNFGRIECTDGDYAGGIAGMSSFMIRGCYSMSEAVSGKYAGGIAGLAHSLVNNICLSAVEQGNEYHGAVAGDTDNADLKFKDRGSISGNLFVFRGLGAINGVTDTSETAALSYEELMRIEGIPDDFSNMTVTFKAEGKTVKKIKKPYGGEIREEEYPEITEGPEGKFGYWEEKDLSRIEQNITVNAVYVDYITSIASGNKAKPDLIAGGRFYDGTRLFFSESEENSETGKGDHIYRSVSFNIESPYGIPENTKITVRYRKKGSEEEDDAVFIKKENGYEEEQYRTDGEYLVFDMEKEGTFYIAHRDGKRRSLMIPAIAVGTAVFIGIILFIIYGKRKKQAQDTDGSEETSPENKQDTDGT